MIGKGTRVLFRDYGDVNALCALQIYRAPGKGLRESLMVYERW
jgi:hypothetical protein